MPNVIIRIYGGRTVCNNNIIHLYAERIEGPQINRTGTLKKYYHVGIFFIFSTPTTHHRTV